MKKLHLYVFAVVIASILFSCKKDEPSLDQDTQELIIESLQGTWSAQEVRKENSVISDFNNFNITVNGKSYSTQNGAPVWPSSGTFDFENIETENEFVRQDGRLFTASVSGDQLTIVIVYQEELARGEYGTYEFTLSK